MKELLEYLIKSIIDSPDQASVTQSKDQSGTETLEIAVATTDMGKIIGKGGKIIKALRDLVKILGTKQNTRINVILKEE